MKRPSLKRPGVTATGRQWQTINALRADGWHILEADPMLWSSEDYERIHDACDRRLHAEAMELMEGYADLPVHDGDDDA